MGEWLITLQLAVGAHGPGQGSDQNNTGTTLTNA